MRSCPLDQAVRETRDELELAGVTWPEVLFLLGTGPGVLPGRLRGAGTQELDDVRGVPPLWRGAQLHHGLMDAPTGPFGAWVLADSSADATPEHPWEAGFPVWLAGLQRASALVHVSAGAALPEEGGGAPGLPVGTLALCSDHINLSGHTPLLGLADSALGPLFPDLSSLHHAGLREAALSTAAGAGIPAAEVVAACTLGPALDTPAERRFQARAGAQVAVQGLAAPLLAAGHAGLATLSVVVITDAGEGPADVGSILRASEAAAPALDELLSGLLPTLGQLAHDARALGETS